MTKLITENYFQTTINNEVLSSAVWEIQIQLNREPVWQFWILILDDEDNIKREEIFYHRKSWTTVYTYDVNRSNPQTHTAWASCVMNDSASIFNFLSDNSINTFYIYKKSINEVYVFWWKVYKDWVIINIADVSLAIYNGNNYIYLDIDNVIKTSLTNPTTWVVVWLVTKSWSSITIEKYNVVWFWFKWDKWDKWDTGNWIDTIELISTIWWTKTYRINFTDWNSYTYEVKDWEVLSLPNYTISNTTTDRSIDANNTTAEEVLNVLWTLYNDIKSWLESIWSEWRWIVSVNKTNTVWLVDTYTITYTDATTSTFNITNWANGTNWTNGVWISWITLVSTVWKVNTYRITFTNATTFDFIVTDWSDWIGWDMYKSNNLSWLTNYTTARTNLDVYSKWEVNWLIPNISWKQDTLVSWINIKTINWNSLLWSWDITISAWASKYCNAYSTVATSSTSWTSATVTLDTFSTNDSWMSVTNNRITITDSWAYQINASITFESNATWVRELYVRKNWTIIKELAQWAVTPPWEYTSINISFIDSFNSWDYLELRWRQSSWWSLNILSWAKYTSLSVFKI